MARGVNKVILIGNLGADPEIRYLPQGGSVANIAVATSESWTDKVSGEKKELTDWHRVVFYNRLAEIVGEYARKGSKVYIEGKLRTRKWQGQDGIERYTTEIIGDELQLLDRKQDDDAPNPPGYVDPNAQAPQGRHFQQAAPQQRPAQPAPAQGGYQQRPMGGAPAQGGYQQRPAQQQMRPAMEPPINFDDDIPF